MMVQNFNLIVLRKNNECYIFFYDDENCMEAMKTLGRFVCNPQLSFTWRDAAFLSSIIVELRKFAFETDLFLLGKEL